MATLDFKGKTLVQNYHLSVKYHELVPKRDRSLTDKVRLDDNLIIHGDNLKALKALLPTYAGKVKCIYIDPPYNTGNEGWAYNDNVNSPMMQEWFGKAVDRDDLTRHDKWLCMMTPRLKLLRDLLRPDGVIFISIDDNEFHHLRVLMNEVFGESNFIANIQWNSRKSVSNDAIVSLNHNHTLLFARDMEKFEDTKQNFKLAADESKFGNPDNDPRGKWTADPFDAAEVRKNLSYGIKNPNTGETCFPPEGRHWVVPEDTYWELLKDGRVVFGKTGKSRPQRKRFWTDAKGKGLTPTTWWDDVGTTTNGTQELEEILENEFDNPKPTSLLKQILMLATDKDSLVLDSFAGSGTTAHAVLALNKEDGGNRKFILVECEDYADTITAERVRRIIKGVKGASDENLKKGLGGTFSYFELGKAIELDSILDGKNLPSYLELARYVFYTATGEEFDERKVNEKRSFVGESKTHEVYLFYQPDMDYLKKTALTLERAESLGKIKDKRRLVFAPTKYLDQEQLDALRIDFAQLPFEIYKLAR
jgi:adenine-specific DNA-methyltransferase